MFKRFMRGSLSIATSNGFSKLFAIGFVIIAGRLLGPQAYGNLAFILSIGAIISTIPAIIFPQALLWRLGFIDDDNSRGEVVVSGITGTIIILLLISIIVIIIPNIPWLVLIIVIADTLTYLFINIHQGLLNYKKVAFFSLTRNLFKFSLVLVLWFGSNNYEWNYSHVVLIYLLAPMLVITTLEIFLPTSIINDLKFDCNLLRQLGLYGLPIAGSSIAITVLMRGDVVLLEYFDGETVTGNYYAAKQLFIPIMLFPVALKGLLVPIISGKHLLKDEWSKSIKIVLSISAFLAIFAGFSGPFLVEKIYGPSFQVDQSLTLMISVSAWILSVRSIIEAILLGNGYSLRTFVANLCAAFFSLFLYLNFISAYGSEGAAQALLLSSIFALIAMILSFISSEIIKNPFVNNGEN